MDVTMYIYYGSVLIAILFMLVMMNMDVILKRTKILLMGKLKMHPVIYSVMYEDGKISDYVRNLAKEGKEEGTSGAKIGKTEYYKFDSDSKYCVMNDTLGAKQCFFEHNKIQAIPIKDVKLDLKFDSTLFSMLLIKSYMLGRMSLKADEKRILDLLTFVLLGTAAALIINISSLWYIMKIVGSIPH